MSSGKRIFLFLLLFIPLSSCQILTFETFMLDCSVDGSQEYFSDEKIFFFFSSSPLCEECERMIYLSCQGISEEIVFEWLCDTELMLCPKTGWKKGKKYQLGISGKLLLEDQREYSVDLNRFFYYGTSDDFFTLDSVSLPEFLGKENVLAFEFSQGVKESSFLNSFSISPSISYKISISEDKRMVMVQSENGWKINTRYTWSLSQNLLNEKEVELRKKESGNFIIEKDFLQPELICLCPVNKAEDDFVFLKSLSLDNIRDKQMIGFEFSKEMNLEKLRSAIYFTPSLQGTLHEVGDDCKKYVFIPEENYEPEVRYDLRISESACDKNDIPIPKELHFFFTSENKYLSVLSLESEKERLDEKVISRVARNSSGNLHLCISFSTVIPPVERSKIEQSVFLLLLFPFSVSSPVLKAVHWSIGGKSCFLEWENVFSDEENPVYYQLNVRGGKEGIKNEWEEYLKEDLCYVFTLY